MEFCKKSSTYSRDIRKRNPSENEKKLRERNNIFCVGKQKTMHREREREREIDKFNYNKMVRIRKKKRKIKGYRKVILR